ncbi:ThuA domain-containing protein [Aquimarina algiphila]|uniref:DUF1080 domain-containing protein n=1 Tax=Aquimarina algiphila TaxID=2047982 RepID=A0A554VQM4_9FLAO|nr:ThuA domain-containing protein [Aquimarina algiphila]TSE10825.1 DUF1080 domain-containing protein [Aquimarina algiphila]
MLQFIKFTFLAILMFCLVPENAMAQKLEKDELPSLKGKKVIMVYGGWDGHQPKVFADRVNAWLKTKGAEVTVSNSLDIYADEKKMSETDLIIQYWTMGEITKEQEKGLLQAVKNGTGLAGCHGGLGDSFRKNTEYQYMIGGQWVAHPGGKIDYKVDIVNIDDPITKGLTDFDIKDTEQYYMHVDPNSKVLATTTFGNKHNGWIEGAVMPVSWKKHYAKGRIFYLSIGHDPKDFDTPSAWKLLTRGIRWASGSKYQPKENTFNPIYSPRTGVNMNQWKNLIDKKLSMWDVFMGAPHTSTEIEGYKKFDDVTKGTPIGLNKDPKKVFSVIEENGEEIIKITGEIFAGLVTKKEYENYHLTWKFKWGDKRWQPRLEKKRNSGILYHSIGDYTDFWNVWMTSIECEVQQTDCGDLITLGNVKAKAPAIKKEKKYYFTPGADLVDFSWNKGFETGRCFKPNDPEKGYGEWNTMELICVGNRSIHLLNGEVVMVVVDPKANLNGEWKPMNKGKIQIQSEAAEVFYKDIQIRSVKKFPEKYMKFAVL